MENHRELENLIKELSQGREMATELQKHLKVPSSSTNCEYLLHKILNSYDKALSIIENNSLPGSEAKKLVVPTNQDSPPSLANEDSNQNPKSHASKKRKDVVKWTQKVKMCTETGEESQLEDEYYWRKYGEKHILGAKHPRGYFRCTHRHGQGCFATKQVQRSDDHPTIFDITYRRKHTCNTHGSPSNVNNPNTSLPELQNIDPISLPENLKESSFNTQTSLGVFTQTLGPNNESPFTCRRNSPNMTSESSRYFRIPTNHDYRGISSTSTSQTLVTHFPFGLSEFRTNLSFYNRGYFP